MKVVGINGELQAVILEEICSCRNSCFRPAYSRAISHVISSAWGSEEPHVGIAQIDAQGVDDLKFSEGARARSVGTNPMINSFEDGDPRTEIGRSAGGGGGEQDKRQGREAREQAQSCKNQAPQHGQIPNY